MTGKGIVTLIGAGPGDPGLLTVAGRDALAAAEVVLFDRLVGAGVLALIPAGAEKIDVGKNKGNHSVPQDEINRLILHHARAGKRVVRLKGGDPYLFGRGAEELELVEQEGIPFRVVPGVTSAIAVPAYAGIPVTHRNYASSVHILTGHGKNGEPPDIPYAELARLTGTLVFLMSLSACADICRGLMASGSPADTPAALVENGSRENQRRLDGTLATLADQAAQARFLSPALMIVGRVCELAERFDWTARLPLGGKAVLAVSSRETGGRLAALLRESGCAVDSFAGIVTEPLAQPDSFWDALPEYAWIVFTSRTGVDGFFAALREQKFEHRNIASARFAVVGRQTGEALSAHGFYADLVPAEFTGKALGKELARAAGADERILLFRAESGAGDLPDALRERGLAFDDVAAYQTSSRPMPDGIVHRLRVGHYDAVTFTSASSVEAFAASVPDGAPPPTALCIGETTAAAAKACGMKTLTSREATLESLARLVVEKIGDQ